MAMRRGRAFPAVLLGLMVIGFTAFAFAGQGVKKKEAGSAVPLGQANLQGALQGYCGAALDLNDDGRDELVVGAPYARSGQYLGALLIYPNPGDGLRGPAEVLKGDGNLGWSLVALGRQWFAAGAHSGSGEKSSLCGTVSVYQWEDKPVEKVVLEGENAMDKFGYALAAGDFNADGAIDLAVGAPLHSPDPVLYQQGAVYIYFGPDYGPDRDVYIPATAAYGGIGFTVAAGDIDGDGIQDLLLGATGRVIAFYGGPDAFSSLQPDAVFTSRDGGFGRSMAVLGDLDGDGINDLALGAYQAEIGAIDSGRLFVVRGAAGQRTVNLDGVPLHADLLTRIDGDPTCGQFAAAISPLGDFDGDSVPDMAVGAVHADGDPWPMTGAIYLFSGADLARGATMQDGRALIGKSRDMHFGTFLAPVDGGRWLAVGAPTEHANAGRVYVLDLRRGEVQ